MDKITNEMIIDTLKEQNNIPYKVLLIRLLEEYKNKAQNDKNKEVLSLAKFQNSYRTIIENTNKLDNNKEYSYSEELTNEIKKNIIVLNNYMSNFDINNKKKIQQTEDLITILESYLKIPITFTANIEHCLEEQLVKSKKIKVIK